MASDPTWRQEHLCVVPRTDPNEVALREFLDFLEELEIREYKIDRSKRHVCLTLTSSDLARYRKVPMNAQHEGWMDHIMMIERCTIWFRRHFCRHCEHSWAEHLDGKCLFHSTFYEADWP